MKLWPLILLALLLVTSTSCTEQMRKRRRKKQQVMQPFLFRMNYFLDEGEKDMSFPIWFNDSIVRKHKIKTIVHKSMRHDADGELEKKAELIFRFDEQGVLITVQRKKFYENVVVENVTFNYKHVMDSKGFAPVEIIDSLHLKETSKYEYYAKELYEDEYIVYENTLTGDYLFCIEDRKLCEIVSVDSLFNPTPEDIIVYGNKFKPRKKFQVENLVNEKNVVDYSYFEGTGILKRVATDNYPFYNKKNVTVSKSGTCTGYIDSTFSADKYLNRTVSTFKLNSGKLPVKLSHRGMHSGNYELFEYEYYD